LTNGTYLAAHIAIRKWIRKIYAEIEIPSDLHKEILNFIKQTQLYNSPEDFIKEALNLLLAEFKLKIKNSQ